MNTLLKLLCVAVLASFATVSVMAEGDCSGGGCSGKDKKKTEEKAK